MSKNLELWFEMLEVKGNLTDFEIKKSFYSFSDVVGWNQCLVLWTVLMIFVFVSFSNESLLTEIYKMEVLMAREKW